MFLFRQRTGRPRGARLQKPKLCDLRVPFFPLRYLFSLVRWKRTLPEVMGILVTYFIAKIG